MPSGWSRPHHQTNANPSPFSVNNKASGSTEAAQCAEAAVYCSGSLQTIEHLAREGIPVVDHLGLVPWRAVGKTADRAMEPFREVKAIESAGTFAAEIEVVPAVVATAISARNSLVLWSKRAGAGCDAQYLFANDILGYTEG